MLTEQEMLRFFKEFTGYQRTVAILKIAGITDYKYLLTHAEERTLINGLCEKGKITCIDDLINATNLNTCT